MPLVGRIARAHGNRGQVIVDPETDFPEERYKIGSVVYLQRADGGTVEPMTITAVRFQRGRPIIGLAGVETMTDAEALAGRELRITEDALHPLPDGTFYQHDLVGCTVETPDGVAIGTVDRVDGSGAASRLVIQARGGAEILIPLTDAIVVGIHLAARKILVRPVEGLLDLNVTRKQQF
jgi:16S rRNA processing protein RimM